MTEQPTHVPPSNGSSTGERPPLRVSAWLIDGTGTTGDFLGYATLATTSFVVLHPTAARGALTHASPPLRLRVAVDTRFARYVVDGEVRYGSERVPGDLVAVELDFPIAEEPTQIPLPADDEDSSHFTALEEFLQAAEVSDPAQPPATPGGFGYERREDFTDPAKQPPWCRLWPGCWGCR